MSALCVRSRQKRSGRTLGFHPSLQPPPPPRSRSRSRSQSVFFVFPSVVTEVGRWSALSVSPSPPWGRVRRRRFFLPAAAVSVHGTPGLFYLLLAKFTNPTHETWPAGVYYERPVCQRGRKFILPRLGGLVRGFANPVEILCYGSPLGREKLDFSQCPNRKDFPRPRPRQAGEGRGGGGNEKTKKNKKKNPSKGGGAACFSNKRTISCISTTKPRSPVLAHAR